MDVNKLQNIEIGGLDSKDHPDYCDAYIESADDSAGVPLSDDQLDMLNDQNDAMSYINQNAYESLVARSEYY